MKDLVLAVTLLLITGCVGSSPRPTASREAPSGSCAVPGKSIQWIGDYCLSMEQTDDLVAAGDCIAEEQARTAGMEECGVATRYKSDLCKLHLSAGIRPGTLAECVNDPGFSGNIVRNDGSP